MRMKRLAGRNAIITGASQGLGKVIAEHFIRAGANVVLCARSKPDLAATQSELARLTRKQRVLAHVCDVSLETQVNEVIEFALHELGSVEVLVANAGVYGPMGPTETVDLNEWRQALDINLFGVLLPCRALIPHFKKAGYGKIVVLSGGGATNPLPNISSYAASKAAAVRLMETLAEELREFHVDVNAVAPGALKTRLVDQVLAAGPGKVGKEFFAKTNNGRKKARRRSSLARAFAFTSPRRRATVSRASSSARNGTRGRSCTSSVTNWQSPTSIACAESCPRTAGRNGVRVGNGPRGNKIRRRIISRQRPQFLFSSCSSPVREIAPMNKPLALFRFRHGLLLIIATLASAPRAQAQVGVFGNALLFDGTNQYISVTNFGAIAPTNEVTVEFWAYANAIAQQAAFMLQPDDSNNRFNAHISFNNANTYWDFGNIGAGGRLSEPNPPGTISNWTHYAFVASFNSNSMSIYVNGVLSTSKAGMSRFVRGNYDLRIGGNISGGADYFFNGPLDEFRVWNTARTASQILSNFNRTLTGGETNLLLYYRFDTASGTVATNNATATGVNYNGTLVNAPVWTASTIPSTIVTTTNDSGPGSLRQALSDAATIPGADTVTFAPGLSGQTITLAS